MERMKERTSSPNSRLPQGAGQSFPGGALHTAAPTDIFFHKTTLESLEFNTTPRTNSTSMVIHIMNQAAPPHAGRSEATVCGQDIGRNQHVFIMSSF